MSSSANLGFHDKEGKISSSAILVSTTKNKTKTKTSSRAKPGLHDKEGKISPRTNLGCHDKEGYLIRGLILVAKTKKANIIDG